MQCQTANMMQLEVNITFTYWLQVACGENSQQLKIHCFVPETQGCGYPHADVDPWALLVCETTPFGMVLLVSFRILPNFIICREWAGFYTQNVTRALCEL